MSKDMNVYYAQTIRGEELLFRLEGETPEHIIVKKPIQFGLTPNEGDPAMGVTIHAWFPHAGTEIVIPKSALVILPTELSNDLVGIYQQATGGIVTPPKPSLIIPE